MFLFSSSFLLSFLQDYLIRECGVESQFLQEEVPADSQELVAFAQTMEYDLRPILGLVATTEEDGTGKNSNDRDALPAATGHGKKASQSELAYARRSSVCPQDLRKMGVDPQNLDVVILPPAPAAMESSSISAVPQNIQRLSAPEIAKLEALSPVQLQDYLVSECGVEPKVLQDEVPSDSVELLAYAQAMQHDLRPVLARIAELEAAAASPTVQQHHKPTERQHLPSNPMNAPRGKSLQVRGRARTVTQSQPAEPPPQAVVMGGNWDMDSGYDSTEWQKALEKNKGGLMKKMKQVGAKFGIGKQNDGSANTNFGMNAEASQIPRDRGFTLAESFVYKGDGAGNSVSQVFGHIPKNDDDD
jgi:hypothetical protein